jgi:hypothetical protein
LWSYPRAQSYDTGFKLDFGDRLATVVRQVSGKRRRAGMLLSKAQKVVELRSIGSIFFTENLRIKRKFLQLNEVAAIFNFDCMLSNSKSVINDVNLTVLLQKASRVNLG